MIVLMNQERKLAGAPRGWREYYRATPSDAGISALYKWLEVRLRPCVMCGGSVHAHCVFPHSA